MGVIKEFPGLQIDDFRGRPQLTLLTHAHSDHLVGLDRQGYRGPAVWCTATTRSLVLNLRSNNNFLSELKYNHLRKECAGVEILKVLPLDVPTLLHLGSTQILVTAIDAHHCPGSCMFLVQSTSGPQVTVLYTGDIRCEQWWPDMLKSHPILLPFTCARQQINVYLDNIYEQHREHELDYDPGNSGIAELVQLLARGYPQETSFCALFTTTGYEQVLITLSASFKSKIHMDKYYYSLYQSAADSCPTSRALLDCCTTDATARCKIHWCAKGTCEARDRLDSVYFSPCITISRAAVDERNAVLDTTGMSVHGQSDLPVYVNGETGARYVKGSQMLPGHLLFYFSRHASRPALCRLIEIFTVRTVRSLNGNPMEGFSSFKSSSDDPTDESLTSLPLARKQAVKIGNKRKSYSTESSHDEALQFLNGAAKPRRELEPAGQWPPPEPEFDQETRPEPKPEPKPDSVLDSERVLSNEPLPAEASPETMETQASLAQLEIKEEQLPQNSYGLSKFQLLEEKDTSQPECPEFGLTALETQLRQNESTWFSLRFDWQSQ